MSSQQPATIAQQLLRDADGEYESGDIFLASKLLWDAAVHCAEAVMHRNGAADSRRGEPSKFVKDLAAELDEPILFSYFKVAEALHLNFHHGWMEDHQFEESRELVKQFVSRMLGLIGEN